MNGLDSQFLTIFTFERFNIWTFLETSEHLKQHDPLNTDSHWTRLKLSNYFWLPLALSLVCYIDQSTMCFFPDKFPTWIFPIPLEIQVPWKILSQPPILLCEFDTASSPSSSAEVSPCIHKQRQRQRPLKSLLDKHKHPRKRKSKI